MGSHLAPVYDAVLFDVDGVLLAHPPGHPEPFREAAVEAFRGFDVAAADADLAPFYGHDKSLDRMRAVCKEHGLDVGDVWPERERCATALQQEMVRQGDRELYADARVLEDLAATHEVALVSNNQIATIEWLVEHFGLADAVDTIEARRPSVEGFRRGKPDPYYVEQALADLDATSALMVGDRASDVVAAREAGIDAAFLWRERDEKPLDVEPAYELDDLEELQDVVAGDGSPARSRTGSDPRSGRVGGDN